MFKYYQNDKSASQKAHILLDTEDHSVCGMGWSKEFLTEVPTEIAEDDKYRLKVCVNCQIWLDGYKLGLAQGISIPV